MANSLYDAYLKKGASYQPRTQHIKSDGTPQYINELILQSSPYLLQHAHNPVQWHAWSSQTLAKAKKENKLIFLSIGYATCHWCHVMEEESFDDKQVAQALNKDFISIKVDKEIRPDVDEVFMSAVQLVNNGQGGWPLNVVLTPDAKMFYGGTYFPKPQFLQLLSEVQHFWQSQKERVIAQVNQIEQHLNTQKVLNSSHTVNQQSIDKAIKGITASFDELQGGFGQAPKFPMEARLLFLINQYQYQPDEELLTMITTSLDAMAQGGLYDVVGGGFARYATDNAWIVPHFEKMLYNQAQLSLLYAKAFAITQKPLYRRIAEQTLDYVLREMQYSNSGFYSATDADSLNKQGHREEGIFFTWGLAEIKQILGKEKYQVAQQLFDLTSNTLFEGRHIIRYQDVLDKKDFKQADTLNKLLYQQRQNKEKPLLDNKILLSWNAQMALSFLVVGQILNRTDYIQVAKDNFDFLQSFNTQTGLKRVFLDDHYQTDAILEDYAHFIALSLGLYRQTQASQYLQQALSLMQIAITKFWDKEQFGFFNYRSKNLYIQKKTADDGAMFSANAILFIQLIQLNALSYRISKTKYKDLGKTFNNYIGQLLQAFSADIKDNEAYFPTIMTALNEQQLGSRNEQQWVYGGAVFVALETVSKTLKTRHYQLSITLDEGYYINSNQPNDKDLVATNIRLVQPSNWQIVKAKYPQPIIKKTQFNQQPLAVYTGKVTINFSVDNINNSDELLRFSLDLQSCNNQVCLAPKKIFLQ